MRVRSRDTEGKRNCTIPSKRGSFCLIGCAVWLEAWTCAAASDGVIAQPVLVRTITSAVRDRTGKDTDEIL